MITLDYKELFACVAAGPAGRLFGFVTANWPTPDELLRRAPIYLVASATALFLAGILRRHAQWRVGHKRYVLLPWMATAVGGLLANTFFPAAAVAGYLVCGLGDAIAEPVGTCCGRHRYHVICGMGAVSTRSWEGSAAVFLAATVALAAWRGVAGGEGLNTVRVGFAVAVGLVSAVVEAVSPHGWDNLTLQVVPAWLASICLAGGWA